MRLRPNLRRRTLAFAAIIVSALTAVAAVPSEAQTYTVLHHFGSGTDGALPVGGIKPRLPGAGFYGVTYKGGASGDGTMYQIMGPDWIETIVFNFDGANGSNPDNRPSGGGIHTTSGYGTASAGGEYGFGVVYNPSGDAIYSFCPVAPSCIDGATPFGDVVVVAPALNHYVLYGTTVAGGAYGKGTVFMQDLNTGAHTVLHSFGGGTDGAVPNGLTANSAGTIVYGTTSQGGAEGLGTVFSLVLSTGVETVLHSFTGADGSSPEGEVSFDPSGNLYGTASAGGAHTWGTVFEISSTGAFTLLYSFTGGSDGGLPDGGPVAAQISGEAVIGTTIAGGVTQGYEGWGTLWELSTGGKLKVLHAFCSSAACSDGGSPTGPLYISGSSVEGTARFFGAYGGGVLFEMSGLE